ncbi:nuclear transport factor 2 family protein [Fodinibius salsisoli]|uniref:Nuclear transport factor 2 family protein n=1 Tax=Fodinibius salsisoli TaxID=2820877 RepID=A0ABT3PIW4_9BACT|nr:nuclear transport factor 2 family protein [Fodinibius salsisoli]MCW9705876.1 nuclear transport factor 2 family protein [Fodinibius salsisoli]
MQKPITLVALFFCISTISCLAQDYASQSPSELQAHNRLRAEIIKMDSLLFEVAFNKCNLPLYKQIVTDDFEFYDDRSGLNKSLDKEIMSFQDRCSKPYSVTRKLITSEVHILGDYGALQTGEHEFYVNDEKVQKAKFTTIWEKHRESWIMKRAISYDHQDVKNDD